MSDAIPKRSVIVAGHRTSVSLEEPFWTRLKEIAHARSKSINDLVTEIDSMEPAGGRQGNLSSALRLFVLAELEQRLAVTEGPPPNPEQQAQMSKGSGPH
jgi:predicted DNA-binding ribbon-helix-helix protein